MDEQELARLEALAQAATSGPWYSGGEPWGTHGLVYASHPDPHAGIAIADCDDVQAMEEENEHIPENNSIADAAFIAAARQAVPALIAEIRRLWLANDVGCGDRPVTDLAALYRAEGDGVVLPPFNEGSAV